MLWLLKNYNETHTSLLSLLSAPLLNHKTWRNNIKKYLVCPREMISNGFVYNLNNNSEFHLDDAHMEVWRTFLGRLGRVLEFAMKEFDCFERKMIRVWKNPAKIPSKTMKIDLPRFCWCDRKKYFGFLFILIAKSFFLILRIFLFAFFRSFLTPQFFFSFNFW